jgi:RHS repeat-associated protein
VVEQPIRNRQVVGSTPTLGSNIPFISNTFCILGSDPLDETDLAGNTNNASFNEYIFFGGKRIARRDSTNNFNYYFADHLGTARIVANSAGTILDDSDFYPFGGERVISSSSGNNYKFTSKERDAESGLDDFGPRYFGSSMGRFMSPDPIGGHLEDPQTLNRYAYVRNNPVNLTDPTGLDFNLNCDKNNGTTCQGGHQYYKDEDGNYQQTVVKSDKDGNLTDQSGNKYHAEVDGLGVHFSQDGSKTSSLGTWVNGSNETKFSQTSGALAGFSFDFHQTSKEQTANGTFYYPGAPRDAYEAVLKAGFSASMADDFFNPLHGYIGSYHYRSDGDPGTGKNSGHLIIRGVGILHPWDTVPTKGELHFGETNPNVNRIEHFRKDVF